MIHDTNIMYNGHLIQIFCNGFWRYSGLPLTAVLSCRALYTKPVFMLCRCSFFLYTWVVTNFMLMICAEHPTQMCVYGIFQGSKVNFIYYELHIFDIKTYILFYTGYCGYTARIFFLNKLVIISQNHNLYSHPDLCNSDPCSQRMNYSNFII